jgi:shikimate kinase
MPWVSLIGFMCSGKSSTGRMLARQLGWPHYDTDQMIVERTNLTVDEIFREQGEAEFRRLEHEIVEELPPERDLVLSTGGGLVQNERTMGILSVQGPIFWLRVAKSDVLDRCRRPWAAKRPLLADAPDLEERVTRLMAEREPLYEKYGAPVPGGFAHPREAGKHILEILSRRDDFRAYFGPPDGGG